MKKRLLSILLSALLLTACAQAENAPADMTLLAVNVGKADALLLSCGGDTWLIDTGTEESWGRLSAALHSLNVTHLTGVILTHTDSDHAGGAWALATSSIAVDNWYASRYYEGKKASKHPAVLAAALRGQEVIWLSGGGTLPFGSGTLSVLGPLEASEKENNNSVVLLAEAGGCRMLLAGDMEFPEEESLLAAGVIPRCDVLKVGNHGESDATGDALVAAVRPALAVISTNSVEEPDTPAKRVLKLLKSSGARVALTEQAEAGVLVTVTGGQASMQLMSYAPWPEAVKDVALSDKSVAQDAICLRNNGSGTVDLSGWFIFSERGGQTFVFPDGASIAPGQELTVTSLSSEDQGSFVWPDKKVWHKSKDDAARLCDAYGRLIDRLE